MQNTKYNMKELSIEITYKCPMNCRHCSSCAGNKNDTEIPYNKIIEMITECKDKCNTTEVSLSGGEPFEHPKFWEILKKIKSEGLKSIVYSCGVEKNNYRSPEYNLHEHREFIPYSIDRFDKLIKLCDKLIISLHGSQKNHNYIMDSGNNIFWSSIETIKNAVKFGIEVEIHFVPTRSNYKDLEMVYGICVALGVSKMSILRYVPQGRGLEQEEDMELTKEEFLELNKTMLYIKNLKRDNKTTKFRIGIPADFTFLLEYYKGNLNAKKELACTGGKTKILVKADGNVQVCPAWKELDHLSAGNIYNKNIVDIWNNGDTYVIFRNFTHKDLEDPCASCMFVINCVGGCASQRILISSNEIEGLCSAPDPLCFIDLLFDINWLRKKTKKYIKELN